MEGICRRFSYFETGTQCEIRLNPHDDAIRMDSVVIGSAVRNRSSRGAVASVAASVAFRLRVSSRAVLLDGVVGRLWWATILMVPGITGPLATFGGVILFVLFHHAFRKQSID